MGHLIHSDVIGPFPTSRGGSRYCVTFTDDRTRFVRAYLMNHKSDVTACFRLLLQEAATLPDFHVKVLHSDGGGEFDCKAMDTFC